MAQPYFTHDTFAFFRELKENNNREWFHANKQRYESDVQEPLIRFVTEVGPRVQEINPHFVGDPRPHGGSISRIYRDTRFSQNKSPYKTYMTAGFGHVLGKERPAPGFYLHFANSGAGAAGGLWAPDPKALGLIRDAIVASPDAWTAATTGEAFQRRCDLFGETLKRSPKGYAADHPLVEDLKRKQFIAASQFTEDMVCSTGFVDEVLETYRTVAPLVTFLAKAVDLPV